jgi:hypothetical protein
VGAFDGVFVGHGVADVMQPFRLSLVKTQYEVFGGSAPEERGIGGLKNRLKAPDLGVKPRMLFQPRRKETDVPDPRDIECHTMAVP